jgi:hypothetical protein
MLSSVHPAQARQAFCEADLANQGTAMANRATTHLPDPPEVLRPDEKEDTPAKGRQDQPRAGRTTGAGARAERPSDRTNQKNVNAPQPGRGGNGPSPSSKTVRGSAAEAPAASEPRDAEGGAPKARRKAGG